MLIFYVCEPYVVYEKATCSSYFKSLLFSLKRIKWRLLNNVKHKLYLLIKLLFLIVYYFEEWTQMIICFFWQGNSCSVNVLTLLVQEVRLFLPLFLREIRRKKSRGVFYRKNAWRKTHVFFDCVVYSLWI